MAHIRAGAMWAKWGLLVSQFIDKYQSVISFTCVICLCFFVAVAGIEPDFGVMSPVCYRYITPQSKIT